jgi:hypothetical protein
MQELRKDTLGEGAEPMSEKIKLKFMINPIELAEKAYVPDAVLLRVIDPEAIFLLGVLGESGRKLVKAGVGIYFERPLARKLIRKGIAVEVNEAYK